MSEIKEAIDEGFVPIPIDELPGLRWLEAVLLTAVFCMIGALAGKQEHGRRNTSTDDRSAPQQAFNPPNRSATTTVLSFLPKLTSHPPTQHANARFFTLPSFPFQSGSW